MHNSYLTITLRPRYHHLGDEETGPGNEPTCLRAPTWDPREPTLEARQERGKSPSHLPALPRPGSTCMPGSPHHSNPCGPVSTRGRREEGKDTCRSGSPLLSSKLERVLPACGGSAPSRAFGGHLRVGDPLGNCEAQRTTA